MRLLNSVLSMFVLTLMLSASSTVLMGQDEKSPSPEEPDKKNVEESETADNKDEAKKADENTEKTDKAAEEKLSFADLKVEWETTSSKFAELEKKYNEEKDPAKKAEIRKEYSDLTVTSKTLGEKLRTAAIEEYKSKPNENEEITRLLVGMIINDVAFVRYSKADEIANALIEGKADEKHFLALQDSDRISVSDRAIIQGFIKKRQEADNPEPDKDASDKDASDKDASDKDASAKDASDKDEAKDSAKDSSDESSKDGDDKGGEDK